MGDISFPDERVDIIARMLECVGPSPSIVEAGVLFHFLM